MDLKLNHINIKDLTTDALHEDMKRRMASSKGAPVLYPYETVEALLGKIDDLSTALLSVRAILTQVAGMMPDAATKVVRADLTRKVNDALGKIDTQFGTRTKAIDYEDF